MSGISQKAAQVLGDDLLGRLRGVAARSAEANPEVAGEIAAALQNIQHEVKTTIVPDVQEMSQEAIASVRKKASAALDNIEALQTPLAESSGRVLRDSYTVAKGVTTIAGKEAMAEGKVALNAAIDAFQEIMPEIKETAGVVADNAQILAKDAFGQGKEIAQGVHAEALSAGKDQLKTELLQRLIEGKKLTALQVDAAKMAGIDLHALQGEARTAVDLTVDQYHQIAYDALSKGDLVAAKKYYVNTFAAATEAEQVLGVLNKFANRRSQISGTRLGFEKRESYAVLDIYKTGLHRGSDLVKTPAQIGQLSTHLEQAKKMVESRRDGLNLVAGALTLGTFPVGRDAIARKGISNLGLRIFTSAAQNAETKEAANEIAKLASSNGYYDAAASAFERAKDLSHAPVEKGPLTRDIVEYYQRNVHIGESAEQIQARAVQGQLNLSLLPSNEVRAKVATQIDMSEIRTLITTAKHAASIEGKIDIAKTAFTKDPETASMILSEAIDSVTNRPDLIKVRDAINDLTMKHGFEAKAWDLMANGGGYYRTNQTIQQKALKAASSPFN